MNEPAAREPMTYTYTNEAGVRVTTEKPTTGTIYVKTNHGLMAVSAGPSRTEEEIDYDDFLEREGRATAEAIAREDEISRENEMWSARDEEESGP